MFDDIDYIEFLDDTDEENHQFSPYEHQPSLSGNRMDTSKHPKMSHYLVKPSKLSPIGTSV